MNLLIVEDVTLIAERIACLAKKYFQHRLERIAISYTLDDARFRLGEDVFDLMLLDLNLNGQDGFDLLGEKTAAAIHTIIITANKEEAVRAFDLDVADFITKPIYETRFNLALTRFEHARRNKGQTKPYLAIKSKGHVELILISEINYIQAAKNYTNINLKSREVYLHHCNINRIMNVLPANFIRIHRSFITCISNMKRFVNKGAGRYEVVLSNGTTLPMNRKSFRDLTSVDQEDS